MRKITKLKVAVAESGFRILKTANPEASNLVLMAKEGDSE